MGGHARHVTLACVYFGPALEEARSDGARMEGTPPDEQTAARRLLLRHGGRAEEKRAGYRPHAVQLCNNQCTTPQAATADLGELPKKAPLHHSCLLRRRARAKSILAAAGQFAAGVNASDRLGGSSPSTFSHPFLFLYNAIAFYLTYVDIYFDSYVPKLDDSKIIPTILFHFTPN